MILTRLNGGLGNQLFQYAMGRRTAHTTGLPLKLDTEKFNTCTLRDYRLDHFNIQALVANLEDKRHLHILRRQDPLALLHSLLDKFRPPHLRRIIREATFRFQPELRNIRGPAYLDGDWQSPKYFEGAETLLRQEFTLKTPLDEKDQATEQTILDAKQSISVHVRRGDLVSDPETDRIHGTVSPDYYTKAFRQIAEILDYPTYFLFSDDFEWAIENLPSEGFDLRPIDHNGPEKDYADLHLMSCCQHHILANSTFSWWAAWLASNPTKTVLYPKKWFRTADHDPTDIFPESWLPIAQP